MLDSPKKKVEFYERLKTELEKTANWPAQYMYKFIVPNTEQNERKIKDRFKDKKHEFRKNYSRSGKYLSATIIAQETNPESIVEQYKSMEDIKGLVAL